MQLTQILKMNMLFKPKYIEYIKLEYGYQANLLTYRKFETTIYHHLYWNEFDIEKLFIIKAINIYHTRS